MKSRKPGRRAKPGDVVAIPLTKTRAALGRIYRDGAIAILSDLVSADVETVDPASVRGDQGLFVVGFLDSRVRSGEWRIVGHAPFTKSEDSWPPPRFVTDVVDGRRRIYHRGVLRAAKAEELTRALEEADMYGPETLVRLIRSRLKARKLTGGDKRRRPAVP